MPNRLWQSKWNYHLKLDGLDLLVVDPLPVLHRDDELGAVLDDARRHLERVGEVALDEELQHAVLPLK